MMHTFHTMSQFSVISLIFYSIITVVDLSVANISHLFCLPVFHFRLTPNWFHVSIDINGADVKVTCAFNRRAIVDDWKTYINIGTIYNNKKHRHIKPDREKETYTNDCSMNNYANILEFQTWIVYQRVAIDCAGCLCKCPYNFDLNAASVHSYKWRRKKSHTLKMLFKVHCVIFYKRQMNRLLFYSSLCLNSTAWNATLKIATRALFFVLFC